MASDVRNIEVRITPAEGDRLKVVWVHLESGHSEFPVYLINATSLKSQADRTRTALSVLAAHLRATHGAWQTCSPQLDALVECGRLLRKQLFRPVDDSRYADLIENWLAQKPARVNFAIDNVDLHIPWGLLCADGAAPDSATNVPDERFWLLKHSCSATYRRILPTLEVEQIKADNFFLQPVINKSVWSSVSQLLLEDDLFDYEKLPLLTPIHRKKDLFSTWPTLRSRAGLLYFLCHASASGLALSDEEMLTADEFSTELHRRCPDQKEGCVVFLNGCSTATASTQGTFVNAAQGDGYFGFIACEAAVPDVFAAAFGIDFLASWHSAGKPLYEVMGNLVRRHWPLSLLYGLYCYPIVSVHGLHTPRSQTRNLSRERLGTGSL